MLRPRTLRWIVVSLGLAACAYPLAAQDDATPAGHKPIDAWIADLDSERYEVRERATRHLARHGQEALAELAAAADGPRPEVAARAILVLEAFANEDDDGLKLAALERLSALQHRNDVRRRAQERLSEAWTEVSLPIALDLGARMDPEPVLQIIDTATGEVRSRKLILGTHPKEWTGGDEGLLHVARLNFVEILSVRNVPVTADGLKYLADMPSLWRLELYGLDLDEDDVKELQQTLPQVRELDVRSGAMLGVRGQVTAPIAQIGSVEPGSAAEKAGLQKDDVIIKVDDSQVSTFTELTAEIAKRQPGESAVLTLLRHDKPVEREVTFGYWE